MGERQWPARGHLSPHQLPPDGISPDGMSALFPRGILAVGIIPDEMITVLSLVPHLVSSSVTHYFKAGPGSRVVMSTVLGHTLHREETWLLE